MNALEELIRVCERYWKSLEDIDYWWVGWEEKNQCIFDSNSIEIMKKFLQDKYSNYDSWYWWQVLYGEIVFKDRTWLKRWEYDWSEWWEYKKCPERKLDLYYYFISMNQQQAIDYEYKLHSKYIDVMDKLQCWIMVEHKTGKAILLNDKWNFR